MVKGIKDIIRNCLISKNIRRASNLPEFNPKGNILILAPHPDDEALGCGGLISRLGRDGNPPHVVIMTGGGASIRGYNDIPEEVVIESRRKLTLNSARELGLPDSNIHFLDFSDGHIAERPTEQMARLRGLFSNLQPDVVLVPHRGEGWSDHLETRQIGLELQKELAKAGSVVYEYCVWMWYYVNSNLDWQNASAIHMTEAEHASKLRAVEAYVNPTAPDGTPWSGVLPKPFLRANTARTELYFRLKRM